MGQGMRTAVIIPARGGSKGVPRKNIRPLAGKPLIYYAIRTAIATHGIDGVFVSTDDEEIALFAERFGATVLKRPARLAGDAVTIDPVILDAVETIERRGMAFDVILTVQPTSPLLSSDDLTRAVAFFDDPSVETVLSVVDDRHLRWTILDGRPVPAYTERVNRQALPPSFKETGAVIGCRRRVLSSGTRIGKIVRLLEIEPWRSVDIDSTADFNICEGVLRRKHIVFAVIGRPEIGMGHAYRALTLAHEFLGHDVHFVCERNEGLAIEHVRESNYPLTVCPVGGLQEAVLAANPDMVVNDILDTDANYVATLKKNQAAVVNFEDMGLGAEIADLVVNALYPHQMPKENILVGPTYFCLRDEFLHLPSRSDRSGDVRRVLLTFGGTDEGNLTCAVLETAGSWLLERGIAIDVVTGPGYGHERSLTKIAEAFDSSLLSIVGPTARISDYMNAADLAVTSGGRTVLELAALQVPTIVICQNPRELTHRFASAENGVLNLGLRNKASAEDISSALKKVVGDSALRQTMSARAAALDLRNGKQRVVAAILAVLHQSEKV